MWLNLNGPKNAVCYLVFVVTHKVINTHALKVKAKVGIQTPKKKHWIINFVDAFNLYCYL